MNDTFLTGPCADYEHDLVDFLEASLSPERARMIRQHVDTCPRCRAWQAEYAAIDDRLADAMPRPVLSAGFEHALQARLATLAKPATRGDLRETADREHEHLIEALRRGARRHALLDGIGSGAVAASALAAASGLIGNAAELQWLLEGPQASIMLSGIGAAVALGALAWSVGRGAVSMPSWRR
jgi:anti-sigma factor RsiW